MAKYFELSVQERGDRFRQAVNYLGHMVEFANGHDGVIALRGVGIEDEPEFEGICHVTSEGARGVWLEPLGQIVYEVAFDRAYSIPQDFVGPALTTADLVNVRGII